MFPCVNSLPVCYSLLYVVPIAKRSEFMSDKDQSLKLSKPWVTYYREVYALFDEDPEVAVTYNDESTTLRLYVDNSIKADAIRKLLPEEKSFGNVSLKILVIPSNDDDTKESLFRHAFSGNPILSQIQTVDGVVSNSLTYVVFDPSIIQFWNDDLSDLNGVRTMLPHDVAKEVFGEQDGVFLCVDLLDETDCI